MYMSRGSSNPNAPAAKPPGKLVGLAEIAEKLGVSRQRVFELAQRPEFPRPEAELRGGRVWRTDAIDRWIAKHRPGGAASANPP